MDRDGVTHPWVALSGSKSRPGANGPAWNGPVPVLKQEVLFDPRAPGTLFRNRFGIRVIGRTRQEGATDIPLPLTRTWSVASPSTSIPGRTPRPLADGSTVGSPSSSLFMARYTSGMN